MITKSGKSAKAFLAIRNLFLLCALVVPVLLAGADRAKNIPGIDPLPLATGDGSPSSTKPDSQTTPKANDTTNPHMDPSDPGYPKVRNLTVVPEPSEPYTAKISWDLYPDASTPIYVVRYSKPIANRALLLEAYNLTSPPLAAGTQVFLNRNMPEGVYYYAVVTAFELSRDGRLELKPGQNYTVVPFIVYRQDALNPADPQKPEATQANRDPNLKSEDFYIKSLTAHDTEKGVVLNWPALPIRGIEYEVFRSAEPIDSAERIDRAVNLGRVREGTPFFTDEGAIEGKRMYYGIAVRDVITGKVYRDLKYQSSYIDHIHKRPGLEVRYDAFLPESLTAFLVSGDTIQLIWIDPGPAVKEYRVFRNTMPITSAGILANSKELGTVSSGSGGFRDSGLGAGTYYYALLPITTSGELLSVFKAGRTFTMYGVSLRAPRTDMSDTATDRKPDDTKPDDTKPDDRKPDDRKPDDRKPDDTKPDDTKPDDTKPDDTKPDDTKPDTALTSAISGFEINPEGENVRLSWKVVPGYAATRIQAFRAKEPLNDPVALQSKAVLIGDFAVSDGVAVDRNPGAGDHYYCLAEYDPATKTYIAVYFSRHPLTVEESKPSEDAAVRLEKILSGAFMGARYTEAEEQLDAYLSGTDLTEELRSKALFYLGIVKFRLQKYEDAHKIFKDPVAQAHDSERALFWYRISLERMKR